MMTGFQDKVLELASRIPREKVTTYKGLAEAAGAPKACRSVGSVLAENPRPVEVPCHRVVRSDGRVGGYSQGRERKIQLLRGEGVEVRNGVIDLEKYSISLSREV